MIPYKTYGIDDNLPWASTTSRNLAIRVVAVPGTIFPHDFREIINHELEYSINRKYFSRVTKCNIEIYKYLLLNIERSVLSSVTEKDTIASAIYNVKVSESPRSAGLQKIFSLWRFNQST